MAKGGIGKSFVSWRESYNPGGTHWNSDSILCGMSKLFRAYSQNEKDPSGIFKYFMEKKNGQKLHFF